MYASNSVNLNNSEISNENLIGAVRSGAKRLISHKQQLNEINVFPVADGDTGSNLSSLMESILNHDVTGDNLRDSFSSLLDAAFTGARGNSGIIFTQFLFGISSDLTPTKAIPFTQFAQHVQNGVLSAYQAIEEPVEGTILTVMSSWSEALNQYKKNSLSIKTILQNALSAAKTAVEDTPKLLKLLQKNRVVDSGAQGFFYFIEGFTAYLCQDSEVSLQYQTEQRKNKSVVHKKHAVDQLPTFRYCTELLLTGTKLDVVAIKSAIKNFGDSIVVAGNQEKMRLHIHTNQPEKVLELVSQLGTIKQQKVDDMSLQYQVNTQKKYPIALVTDSIADLPKEFIESEQIHVISLPVFIGENQFLDKLTLTSDVLYRSLQQSNLRTSSSLPNLKMIDNLFSFLTTHYQQIICISVSAKLSGTYQLLKQQANKYPEIQMTVIDSKQNSVAEGLLVYYAAKLIKKGLPYEKVVHLIQEKLKTTTILVSVQKLDAMVQSGRLPSTVGKIANRLNLQPIVSLDKDGKGTILGLRFNQKANEKAIYKMVQEKLAKQPQLTYAIVHANAPERASSFTQTYQALFNKEPEYITEVSSIIAMNAGEGCVAIALIDPS